MHVAVSPTSGQLFAVYNDLSSNGDADVFLRTSTDQGATWSPRQRVSTSGSGDQWMPTVAVSPDGANAMVAWYDRRNDPANSWLQRYATLGQVSGTTLTFGRDFALSPAFPVVIGQDPVVVPDYMGDYDMVAAGPADFVGTWGDNRLGNSLHAHQPDVRGADRQPSRRIRPRRRRNRGVTAYRHQWNGFCASVEPRRGHGAVGGDLGEPAERAARGRRRRHVG